MNLRASPRLEAHVQAKPIASARVPKESIPYIEAARAIAPLIVLWVHLALWWCGIHAAACVGDSAWELPIAYISIANRLLLHDLGAHIGVLLFFLVSGFIISHVATIETQLEFLLKRAFRIIPLMLFGVAATYAASSILVRSGLDPTLGFQATSYADLVRSMFLMDHFFATPNTLGVTWTLVAEVSFYAMMFAAYRTLARSPVAGTFLLIAVVAAIRLAMAVAYGDSMPASFFFMQVEFIFVGRAIYLFYSGAATLRVAVLIAGAALVALCGLYTLTPYSRSVFFVANSVAYSWAVAIALFCIMAKFVTYCPAPLRFLSNISYSVYMLHIAVGSFVLNFLTLRYGVWIGWSFWLAFAAVLALSYVTYELIEEPSRKLGRHILRNSRRNTRARQDREDASGRQELERGGVHGPQHL